MRKTPLKRSTKPIPARSRKTKAVYVERRALIARLLAERPNCEYIGPAVDMGNRRMVGAWVGGEAWQCQERSTEVHEILSRARGGSILDEANCKALCHWHHRWVTDHPREAEALGLAKRRWELDDIHDCSGAE